MLAELQKNGRGEKGEFRDVSVSRVSSEGSEKGGFPALFPRSTNNVTSPGTYQQRLEEQKQEEEEEGEAARCFFASETNYPNASALLPLSLPAFSKRRTLLSF